MRLALEQLHPPPQHVLVDGRPVKSLHYPHTPLVKGDARSYSIAGASVLAKVTRDREMAVLAERHPGYGWERNMGYGTPEHRLGIDLLGINAQHRRTFRPISELLTTTY